MSETRLAVWEDKQGRSYALEELSDSHLANIVRLMEGCWEDVAFHHSMGWELFAASLRGEMAIMHAESNAVALMHARGPEDVFWQYNMLSEELERRRGSGWFGI